MTLQAAVSSSLMSHSIIGEPLFYHHVNNFCLLGSKRTGCFMGNAALCVNWFVLKGGRVAKRQP